MTSGHPTTPAEPPATPAPRQATAARNTAGNFLTRLILFPLVVLTSVFVTRSLGTSGRGIYQFLMLPASAWMPMLSMGFGASAIYFVSTKQRTPGEIYGSSIVVAVIQGCVTGVLLSVLWVCGWLGSIGDQVETWLMGTALLLLPLQSTYLMLTRLLQGNSQFGLCNVLNITQQVLSSACLILLVVILGYGVTGALVSMVVSSTLMLAITGFVTIRVFRPTWRVDRAHLREGLHYGIRAWAGDVAARANARVDQLILTSFVDASSLGIYATAVTVSELIWMIPDSLSFVLFNKVAAAKSMQARAKLAAQTHRVVFWCMVVLASLLGFAAPWLVVGMYGQEFADATWALLILLPGAVVMVTPKSVTKFFSASGMPGRSSAMVIVGALVCSIMSLLLVPLWQHLGYNGIYGAAVASTIGYVACALAGYLLYRRVEHARASRWFGLHAADLKWFTAQLHQMIFNRPRPTR